MRKTLLAGMLLAVLLGSCKKEDKNEYESLILGKWINTLVDNQAVETDKAFVLEFRPDKVETYASGYITDSSNKSWIENQYYIYSVDGNNIFIVGSNDFGILFQMEFKILSVDQNTLTYSVSKFIMDGLEYPDSKIYSCKKISQDFSAQFVGTWYGKSATAGSPDTSHHYWQYFPDGHYNYYYRDSTGLWVNKPDNNGKYFLYGDFMASNYSNDLISGGTGQAYECWNFSITGNTMTWTGLRENGHTTGYQMEKVSGPPKVMGK